MSEMYTNLEEFLGSYFHQDWMEDASSSMGIVEKYLSEWPLDEAKTALQELQSLLSIQNNGDLQSIVTKMGCYFNPASEGYESFSEWMNAVEKEMRRVLS
jgi:hypothetical protein